MKGELTIYDVAKMAGVSAPTVSRVLNQHRGVNAETVNRVNEVLLQTGFKPRWKAGGNKTVGILLPPYRDALLDPYDSHILSFCCDEFMEMGYSLQIICPSQLKLNAAGKCALWATHLLSGVIVVSAPPNYELCRQLLKNEDNFPCVVIGKLNDDAPGLSVIGNHILSDDYSGGYQAAMLLLRHNHRSFHLVSASLSDVCHRHRLNGILAALRSYDIPEENLTVTEIPELMRKNGEQLAADLACRKKRSDALIFTQGSTCAGFIDGCNAMKLNVPGDFSVVGFEDSNELEHTYPPVTVLHAPTEKIGRSAVQALMALIEHRPLAESGLIPYSLMIRQSVRTR